VAAALTPALVDVAGHDARSAHRSPRNVLERGVLWAHVSVLVREHELRRRCGDRAPQVGDQLVVESKSTSAADQKAEAVREVLGTFLQLAPAAVHKMAGRTLLPEKTSPALIGLRASSARCRWSSSRR
jgi:hypothetical protein